MLAVDPVCNTEIHTDQTKFITEYKGRTYYFESPACQHAFEEDPEAYVTPLPEKVYNVHGERIDGSE